LDRLARKRKRRDLQIAYEKKLTQEQKIINWNKILTDCAKQCEREGLKKCPHGIGFSGYECFVCSADKIADRLREMWSPSTTYKILVYDGEEGHIPLTIKTRGLTKKITEMQENGFWYPYKGSPVYMAPGNIKVVVVDQMVQSHGYNDPDTTPEPTEHGKTRHVRR
jgi:hypothetical protein